MQVSASFTSDRDVGNMKGKMDVQSFTIPAVSKAITDNFKEECKMVGAAINNQGDGMGLLFNMNLKDGTSSIISVTVSTGM